MSLIYIIALILLMTGTSGLSIFLFSIFSEKQSNRAEKSHGKTSSRHSAWLILAILPFVCLSIMIWFYNLDLASGDVGQVKAEPIIQALDLYKNETGEYPYSIGLLHPKYLKDIPTPDWRQEYRYYPYSTDNVKRDIYKLEFKLNGGTDDWYCYDSYTKKWEYYDSYCQYDLPFILSP